MPHVESKSCDGQDYPDTRMNLVFIHVRAPFIWTSVTEEESTHPGISDIRIRPADWIEAKAS
jgi:hypothetical protein